MEKKKLIQSVKGKPKDKALLSGVFLKEKGNNSTASLVQLYDRCLLIYSNSEGIEPQKKISFDFDLIFELMRGNNEDEIKKRTGTPFALKFERHGESFYIYQNDQKILKEWRDILGGKLNQRGFHELFKPIKKIGKGNFASVYLAIRLEDQKKFAIKAFSKQATYAEDKGKESLINQIQLMRKFNHKNLMKLFEVYESDNSIYISVELLEGGQLYDKIKAKTKFTSDQTQLIMKGLLLGLQHMHAKRVMHRDLKPENILFRKEGDYDCVIADFGLATWADESQYLFVRCGTPGYVAPEIVNIKDMKAKCDPICDLFSVGVIFHILLTGKSPFPGKTYNEVLAQNRACDINFQTQECLKLSSSSLDLLKRLLQKSHKSRITATQALKHPFFSSLGHQTKSIIKQVESDLVENYVPKAPFNKTSIMVATGKNSIMCNSPLMTSSNPFRKHNQQLLKDDSCLKFKMKQAIMTGKTQSMDSHDSIDSPMLKRNLMKNNGQTIKQSRFGNQRKNEAERQ